MSLIAQMLHHPWTEVLGWALLHFLWQGVLIAAVFAMTLFCLRQSSANAR
jgi:hypothetical protein